MERRFDMSDFEQSLKDHADQFKLMPSKRVWNGIYNNLHPGSKWPSIIVAIVFLITLITIGNLNNSPKPGSKNRAIVSQQPSGKDTKNVINKQTNNRDLASAPLNSISKQNYPSGRQTITPDSYLKIHAADKRIADNSDIISEKNTGSNNLKKLSDNLISAGSNNQKSSQNNYLGNNVAVVVPDNPEYLKKLNNNIANINNDGLLMQESTLIFNESELENFQNNNDDIILKEAFNTIKNDLIYPISNNIFSFAQEGSPSLNFEKNVNTGQINRKIVNSENENRQGKIATRIHRKKNKNIQWSYYAAPTISTASFVGKGIEPQGSPIYSPIVIFQTPSSNGMIYNAKLGFEAGAEMTYNLSKKWKFATGANLRYWGYNIVSNFLHPTLATLMLKDESTGLAYSKSYITYYGNGQSSNQTNLSNYNLQFSIPIGLQYMVWGNKNIQINIESTIEPSLVLKSNAYIISADKRYYVNDPSLIRKMNLGGNFGSFVTFSSRKVKWHIGPELHYQLLSTYKNYYPIKEHLIDYGIRIGISK